MDCIFCKIAKKEIPAALVHEGKSVVAFKDISPQAPVHLLVIPKTHIATLNDLPGQESELVTEIFTTVQKLAKDFGIAESGYRTVINCNEEGGQTVFHLHVHVIGGKQLGGSMAG